MDQGVPLCPCCGAKMDEDGTGTRVVLKCPSCGLADVRMKD